MNTVLHCENQRKDVYEHDTGESGLLADGFSAVLVQMHRDLALFKKCYICPSTKNFSICAGYAKRV